jgi:uncharacterized protein YgbK (DUF1537 family)
MHVILKKCSLQKVFKLLVYKYRTVDGQCVARQWTSKHPATKYTQSNNRRNAISMQQPVNNFQLSALQQQQSRTKDVFYVVCVKLI